MANEELTHKIIGCAMKVHAELKSGFHEKIYHRAMEIELKKTGLSFISEQEMDIFYSGVPIGKRYVDLFIENTVMVELKAVSQLEDVHLAQGLNYLEAAKIKIGLLINFGSLSLQFKRLYNNKLL